MNLNPISLSPIKNDILYTVFDLKGLRDNGKKKTDVIPPTFEELTTREATKQIYEILSMNMDKYESAKRKKVLDECCDEEELLNKEKVRKKVRKHYKYISELIGPEIEKYNENEVSDFLKWYFFRDYDMSGRADIFYHRLSKAGEFKRLHSHMKDGKFAYNYEDFVKAFMDVIIPREEEEKLNDIRMALECLTMALKERMETLLNASKQNVQECVLKNMRYELEKVWQLLMNVFQVAKDDVEMLESFQEQQKYISILGMSYIDIVSNGIINIFRTLAFGIWEKQGINDLLKQIKSYMDTVDNTLREEQLDTPRYEIGQNYTAKLWIKILCRERVIWSEIHGFLLKESESEEYSKYKEEYSVDHLEELNPEEFGIYNLKSIEKQDEWLVIKKCFCEGEKSSYLDIKSFSMRFNDCKKVWRWYKEERNVDLGKMEWRTLKAIYRELYLYNDMPQMIKQVKGEGFIRSIKKEEFKNSKVMNELEMFYLCKIKRGTARECNMLEKFNSTEVILCCYYEYEIRLFEKNWSGKYLSKLLAYICGSATSYKR